MILGIEISFAVITLILCGLLAATEKAVLSVNRNNMRVLADEGNPKAIRVMRLLEKPNNLFATLLGLTLVSSFVVTCTLAVSIYPEASNALGIEGFKYGYHVFVVIFALILGGVYLTLAFIYPRQIALRHTEKVAMALSGYAGFFIALLTPCVLICGGIVRVLLRITGQSAKLKEEAFSEEEVMSMLEVGRETGVLKEEGKKMIDSIFAFDDKLAYEVMTPRTDVFSIDIEDEPEEYMDELMGMRYSRIPVYEEDTDNIIGILNIKDFLIKARERGFFGVELRDILRPAFFVPETKNIDGLFFELQKQKQHIAILIDEYGGFSGIVTMEDLIEEVMGNIDDEYDEEEPTIEQLGKAVFLIDGNMDLDDINEEIGTDFESDNSETIGGFLIEILGEIPGEGQEEQGVVVYENYRFTIEKVMDRRIVKVKLEVLPKVKLGEESGAAEEKE